VDRADGAEAGDLDEPIVGQVRGAGQHDGERLGTLLIAEGVGCFQHARA